MQYLFKYCRKKDKFNLIISFHIIKLKSLHFCTPLKIAHLNENTFWTIRTGWIPQIFEGDIVKIKHRTTLKPPYIDTEVCLAKCTKIVPLKLKDIPQNPENQEEIMRYGKKFNPNQYFFMLNFQKLPKTA